MRSGEDSVAVLGAGIQGATIALEAARRGLDVDLFEMRERTVGGASLHNEGKIHLGFVFANDQTLATSSLQARGAGSFAPLLRSWLGAAVDSITVSRPFHYVVHADSMVDTDELNRRYLEMATVIRRHCGNGTYFGIEDCHLIERWPDGDVGATYGPAAAAVFSTREIAIDPTELAALLSNALDCHPSIRVHTSAVVRGVEPHTRCVTIEIDGRQKVMGPYQHVVNCLWSGRLAIDRSLDLLPRRPWSHRMKYFVRLEGAATATRAPSTTIVLGPFGDVVDYGTGSFVASWYPAGQRGFSTDVVPPPWDPEPTAAEAASISEATRRGLRSVVPGVDVLFAQSLQLTVRGGLIYAIGHTDIDDADSMLHSRSHSGPVSQGWYHTVDTGKYTTAPLFAVETVGAMLGDDRR